MALKGAPSKYFGTQKVEGAIFTISPLTFTSDGGSAAPARQCVAYMRN